MSRSKLKKFHKLKSMNHMIQPSRDELLKDQFKLKGAWSKKFGNNNPIIVELGCGKGEYSIGLAELFPQYNYLGIDIKGSRMYTGVEIADSKKLTNVYFIRTQIEYLDYIFDANEVSEIWITFPDPQIKFNRRKKRLVFPLFLKKYKKILKKGGVINLKTDSMFLHGYTLGLIENGPFKIHKSMHDIYHNYHNDERLNIKTHYEKMFLNNNQPISFLSFSFL